MIITRRTLKARSLLVAMAVIVALFFCFVHSTALAMNNSNATNNNTSTPVCKNIGMIPSVAEKTASILTAKNESSTSSSSDYYYDFSEDGFVCLVVINTSDLVVLPTDSPIKKAGRVFAGWYDNKEFSGNPVVIVSLGTSGPKTFYAKYVPLTYKVSFVLNGGSYYDENIAPTEYTYGTEVVLPTAEDIYLDRYAFVGWFDNAALEGSAITLIPTDSVGDKTYYAKWEQCEFDINLNINGGSYVDGYNPPASYVTGNTTRLPSESYIYKTNCIFAGWYDNATFEGDSVSSISKNTTGDITLYARWIKKLSAYTWEELTAIAKDIYYNGQASPFFNEMWNILTFGAGTSANSANYKTITTMDNQGNSLTCFAVLVHVGYHPSDSDPTKSDGSGLTFQIQGGLPFDTYEYGEALDYSKSHLKDKVNAYQANILDSAGVFGDLKDNVLKLDKECAIQVDSGLTTHILEKQGWWLLSAEEYNGRYGHEWDYPAEGTRYISKKTVDDTTQEYCGTYRNRSVLSQYWLRSPSFRNQCDWLRVMIPEGGVASTAMGVYFAVSPCFSLGMQM